MTFIWKRVNIAAKMAVDELLEKYPSTANKSCAQVYDCASTQSKLHIWTCPVILKLDLLLSSSISSSSPYTYSTWITIMITTCPTRLVTVPAIMCITILCMVLLTNFACHWSPELQTQALQPWGNHPTQIMARQSFMIQTSTQGLRYNNALYMILLTLSRKCIATLAALAF